MIKQNGRDFKEGTRGNISEVELLYGGHLGDRRKWPLFKEVAAVESF